MFFVGEFVFFFMKGFILKFLVDGKWNWKLFGLKGLWKIFVFLLCKCIDNVLNY